MGYEDIIYYGIEEIIQSLIKECSSQFEDSPLIKMIAASEMKNIMEMKGQKKNNKVINELKDSLNFKNEFIDKVSEELHEKIYIITEKLFVEFYMNIWKHQLSKIDLSQFEVENCLNDFFYGRIGSDFATTLSEKFINSM